MRNVRGELGNLPEDITGDQKTRRSGGNVAGNGRVLFPFEQEFLLNSSSPDLLSRVFEGCLYVFASPPYASGLDGIPAWVTATAASTSFIRSSAAARIFSSRPAIRCACRTTVARSRCRFGSG